jgi:hypothetical protein
MTSISRIHPNPLALEITNVRRPLSVLTLCVSY